MTKETKPKHHGLTAGKRVRENSTGHTGVVLRMRATLRGEYADIRLTKSDSGEAFKPPREKSVRPSALTKF